MTASAKWEKTREHPWVARRPPWSVLLAGVLLLACAGDRPGGGGDPAGAAGRAPDRASASPAEGAPGQGVSAPVVAATEGAPGAWLGGQRLSALSTALARAADGDRIELEPGVHAGPLSITLSVDLVARSTSAPTIIESSRAVCLRVRAGARVTLEGLVIRARGARRTGEEAAIVVTGGSLQLLGATVESRGGGAVQVLGGQLVANGTKFSTTGWQNCVQLAQGTVGSLLGCTLENTTDVSSGLEVWASEAQLADVEIRAGGTSLVLVGESMAQARRCLLEGRTPAWVQAQANVTLTDCQLRRGEVGLRCLGEAVLERCRLAYNKIGVLLSGPLAHARLVGCTWRGDGQWVEFVDAEEAQVVFEDEVP